MTLLEKLRARFGGIGRIVLYTSLLLPGAARAGAYEDYFQAIRMDNVYFLKQLMQRGMGPNLIEPKRGSPTMAPASARNCCSAWATGR